MKDGSAEERGRKGPLDEHGQIVLVLQGGGALGAYQAGVYEALHEAGVEPDWVIGTSIGAINAALITGNAADDRIEALRRFWREMRLPASAGPFAAFADMARLAGALGVMAWGLPGFFTPNPAAFVNARAALGAERAGYYSTRPLRRTLEALVDVDRINRAEGPRLTVGAAAVSTGQMRYFDSRRETLGLEHVMASGALPPAFPAVRIGGELYWDGGVLSNTPVETVFDDNPRRDSVVFAVHMWRPDGAEPQSIWEVANREKDLRYASRAASHIRRQRDLHRLRHVISELSKHLPAHLRDDPEVRELRSWGCTTTMHVVRLLAPRLVNEDHLKDIDFSAEGVRQRWAAGLEDMRKALDAAPWRRPYDPIEGFVLHEISEVVTSVAPDAPPTVAAPPTRRAHHEPVAQGLLDLAVRKEGVR